MTRDPQTGRAEYDRKIGTILQVHAANDRDDASLSGRVWSTSNRLPDYAELLMLRYGRGDSMEALAAETARLLPLLYAQRDFIARHGPEVEGFGSVVLGINGIRREYIAFAAFAMCTLETREQLAQWAGLLLSQPDKRSHLLDLLVKSYLPDYRMAKKYKRDKYQAPWMDPVLRALALPPDARAGALAAHMKKWCRILRPWGWKPALDVAPGKDRLFYHAAYEVALAVCAYDIDDSSFRDHPYYPRELAAWYRERLRHGRDDWRPMGSGAGIAVEAPPLPARADLANSKRKAIARWIELAADGDADAVDAVLETVGRPRKVEDIDELLAALYENGHAIHADIKDDETLGTRAGQLAEARGMGDFEGPPGPPFGPARCEAILDALGAWVRERGYCLLRVASDGDAWNAVLVQAAYADELRALSDTLRIRLD